MWPCNSPPCASRPASRKGNSPENSRPLSNKSTGSNAPATKAIHSACSAAWLRPCAPGGALGNYTTEKVRTICAPADELRVRGADSGFVMANSTRSAHSCFVKITEDVRESVAEPSIAEEEARERGLEAKLEEFVANSADA